MRKRVENDKSVKITLLILLIAIVSVMFASCSSVQDIRGDKYYHDKIQKNLSWDNYNSPKNRVKRAKNLKKAIESQEKSRIKEAKLKDKIQRIGGTL